MGIDDPKIGYIGIPSTPFTKDHGGFAPLDLGENRKNDTKLIPIETDKIRNPFSSICRLTAQKDRDKGSTGFFISGRHILTAGHTAKAFKNWDVDQYYNGYTHFPTVKASTTSIHPNYLDTEDPNYDIAILKIASDAPDTAYFQTITEWSETYKDKSVYVCGYGWINFKRLRFHQGQFKDVKGNLAAHNCDTYRGQSGSPVVYNGTINNKILGVHVGGNGYAPDTFTGTINKCILFTDEIYTWINNQMGKS